MMDIILIAITALVIIVPIRYIIKQKKAGAKCIGCSHATSCSKDECK